MSNTFSGLEMLRIAILMEEQGADFYKKGAANTTGEISEFLLNTANQELSHKEKFTKLYDEMAEGRENESEYLFNDEVSGYLEGLTENQVFNKDDNRNYAFKDLMSAAKSSLEKEELTVKVYTELYKGVKDENSKEVMNKIIDEEKYHVKYFSELINKLEEN